MTTWSLPRARPISFNDCPALQRPHMSICWLADSFTRLLNVINTTLREKIYTRWCCIDRLSWHRISKGGPPVKASVRESRSIKMYVKTNASAATVRHKGNGLAVQPQQCNEILCFSLFHRFMMLS